MLNFLEAIEGAFHLRGLFKNLRGLFRFSIFIFQICLMPSDQFSPKVIFLQKEKAVQRKNNSSLRKFSFLQRKLKFLLKKIEIIAKV